MSNTLKVTIDEECFINGMDLGGRKTITVSTGINQFTRQVKKVKTSTLSALVKFDTTTNQNAGQYIAEKVRYLRFTNLSRDVDAMLHFHGGAVTGNPINAYFSLPANTSMMVFGNVDTSSPGSDKTGVEKSFFVATNAGTGSGAGSASVALEDLEIVNAVSTSEIQIETIVATV
jgi:hypothetical protein